MCRVASAREDLHHRSGPRDLCAGTLRHFGSDEERAALSPLRPGSSERPVPPHLGASTEVGATAGRRAGRSGRLPPSRNGSDRTSPSGVRAGARREKGRTTPATGEQVAWAGARRSDRTPESPLFRLRCLFFWETGSSRPLVPGPVGPQTPARSGGGPGLGSRLAPPWPRNKGNGCRPADPPLTEKEHQTFSFTGSSRPRNAPLRPSRLRVFWQKKQIRGLRRGPRDGRERVRSQEGLPD